MRIKLLDFGLEFERKHVFLFGYNDNMCYDYDGYCRYLPHWKQSFQHKCTSQGMICCESVSVSQFLYLRT